MITYEELDKYLGDKWERPAPRGNKRNTRVRRREVDGAILVRLYHTNILKYHTDGTVELNSGGWLTHTTKDRLNEYLRPEYCVTSDRGYWYVYEKNPEYIDWSREGFPEGRVVPCWVKLDGFYDGMVLPRERVESEDKPATIPSRLLA